MSKTPGKSYVDIMLAILADFGFQIQVHSPKGKVNGVESRILILDDITLEDRAALKNANFGLHYGGDYPVMDIDYCELERRIEAAWRANGRQSGDPFIAQLHRAQEQRLRDYHVVQRRTRTQTKHWETKAAIKSRQLRNRQKGK